MKAMIFAAGLGTRLRPLTNTLPKALVEINGIPLLEIVLKRLIAARVDKVIINVHHFAEQIIAFLKKKNNFGLHVEFSYEDPLLDTGGGLKKAGFFLNDDKEPFIVHNVDIISNIDLQQMYDEHLMNKSLATLSVRQRPTSRCLLFNQEGYLCGWKSLQEEKTIMACEPEGEIVELAFDGIHIVSPQLLKMMVDEGVFSIIKSYLDLARKGEKICAFRSDAYEWSDVGRIEHLRRLSEGGNS